MKVIYLLIPISLALGSVFLIFFIWATRKGQYDDLETPALRMLLDHDEQLLTERKRKET